MPVSGEMVQVEEFTRIYPRGVGCVTCFGTDKQICKSRIFLSFHFTGEDPKELDLFLSSVCDSL